VKPVASSTRRQLYLLAALAAVLILAVVRWGGKGSTNGPTQASAPAVSGSPEEDRTAGRARPGASREKKISPEDVPIVTIQDLEPPRARGGDKADRNIFDPRQPTATPRPTPTPPPPPPPAPGSAAFIGPLPPPAPTATPVPPEISFKFIGTFGPKDRPVAVLIAGDQLVNARAGDVVFDRFIVRNIGYESVDIGFVGYSPSVTKRLGMTQ
jgi:hypothetical protein